MAEDTHYSRTHAIVSSGFSSVLQEPVEIQPWPFSHRPERSLVVDAKGKRFVLTAESTERSFDDIEQEYLSVDILIERAFDLAVPILPANDGKPCHFTEGRYWTLRPYIESSKPFNWRRMTWNETHCAEAGRVLAMLHCAGDGANLSPGLVKRLKPSVDWQSACLERIRHAFAIASEFGVMPGYNLTVAAAEAIVGRLQGRVEQVVEVQAMIEEWLRAHGSKYAWRALLHGDFHPGNLLFRGSAVKAVIDWDYSRLDDPLFDLAYARLMFCGRFREADFSRNEMFDKELCDKFEASYRDHLDSTQSEHYLWLIVLCSLVMGENATRQEEAMAADILAAYSEIVLALILVFELEELVKPKLLSDQEIEQQVESDKGRSSENNRELELSRQAETQQMERNAGNILEFFS
ncbi:MAG: phosphotransferase [Candidatus Obscuribacterales bacterium]|jgi:Ser/Thr protein kinase RdoA (MazF antagonist)